MKRRPITLLAGAAAVAGLTGAYFGLKSYNEKTEEASLEEASREEILNIDVNEIEKVSFYISGEEEIFLLEDGQCNLERDETFPADRSSVLSPVMQLAPLQAVRRLDEIKDISEYGLDTPQNVITLTDSNGQVTKITIGDTNDSTENDYIMLGNDETVVYTIEDSLRNAFLDDLYDYAYSDEMPTLLVSDINGVSVQEKTGGYKLYLEDAKWMISVEKKKEGSISAAETESQERAEENTGIDAMAEQKLEDGTAEMPADQDNVNTVMSSLGSLAYTDYITHNSTDDSLYGFGETDTVLTVYYLAETDEAAADGTDSETEDETEIETETRKEQRSVSFRIGTTDNLGNYYVQMEGSAEVHTLSSSILENFIGKRAVDWKAAETE